MTRFAALTDKGYQAADKALEAATKVDKIAAVVEPEELAAVVADVKVIVEQLGKLVGAVPLAGVEELLAELRKLVGCARTGCQVGVLVVRGLLAGVRRDEAEEGA